MSSREIEPDLEPADRAAEPAAGPGDTDPGEPPKLRVTPKQLMRAAIGIGLAAVLIVVGMPLVAQTGWHEIGQHLGRVGWRTSLELFGLVLLGLWLYTFTLTGSLPGLRHFRALVVNLGGSAVSNLLPGGGAVGMAATYFMCRSWGFTRRSISTSLIVSGVWNVLGRIALPLIGIVVVSLEGNILPTAARSAALVSALIGLLVLVAFVLVLLSPHWTDRIARVVDRRVGPLIARVRRDNQRPNLHELIVDQRGRIAAVTGTGWLPMTVGVAGFLGVYFLLFWRTMSAVGVDLPVADIFAAYAVGRLLSTVGITPGGLGIAEAGTLAVLVAWGADKPAAAAGVLVFAVFSHLLEVPLGALGWLAWSVLPKVPGRGAG